MHPQLTKDTYIVPQMSQEDVDARFAEIVHDNPEMAALERDVVAAYDQNPSVRPNEQIGGIAIDAARQENRQPAEHILDPEHGEQLGPVQMAAKATAAVVKLREDYTMLGE